MKGISALLACISAPLLLHAQTSAPPGDLRLPVKRIVLYKNGVGFFEHLGKVRGKQEVTIVFTTEQLNDVLKSLTILDLGGGQIQSVTYNSSGPVERRLDDLRLPGGDKNSLSELLGGLRGARMEVRSGALTVAGRLLSVERKTRISGGTTLEVDYLSLLTDSGEVRTTEISPAFSVKLLEPGLGGKLGRYLDLVGSAREIETRRVRISAAGTGERPLFVSYISEVPVWKTTYRILLPSQAQKRPLLQGWAIVDNVVGEDWNNVELSLVAGAPQSFVQKISQPYYARRPEVDLPEQYSTLPQTHQALLSLGPLSLSGRVADMSGAVIPGASATVYQENGSELATTRVDEKGEFAFRGLPPGKVKLRVAATGFATLVLPAIEIADGKPTRRDVQLNVGSVAQTVEVSAGASSLQTATADTVRSARSLGGGSALGRGTGDASALAGTRNKMAPLPVPGAPITAARAALESAASPQQLGDLFEYKIKDPITILRNQSALVPILNAEVGLEKISLWNPAEGAGRPRRGLWLTNLTPLTLDGGAFSVMEDETFAGEGIVETIAAGEKRLVTYAADLAVHCGASQGRGAQRITRVQVSHGVMRHATELRESKTYTVRNEGTTARTVIIEHPVRDGFLLRGETKPVESSAGWHRFRLAVPPKQTGELKVEEARLSSVTYALTRVYEEQLALWVRDGIVQPELENALRRVIALKAKINGLEELKEKKDQERSGIFDDQQRLRENIKSLKGSAEEKALLQRYTQRLNEQESRLEALGKELEALTEQITAGEAERDRMIQSIEFEDKR